MGMVRTIFTSTLLVLAATALVGGTPEDLFQAVKKQWPDKKQGLIVCKISANEAAIQSLSEAATKAGITLEVCNVASDKDVDDAAGLVSQAHPDFLVLVDQDPVLGEGGKQTRKFIKRAFTAGVPTLGTGPGLVKLGAALGPA